jgi:phosphomannomutase
MRKPLSLKIGISGVRGIVGESLTPGLVTSFAAAFGTYCGRGPVLIGTDTRPSREMVTQAAVAGLLSVGSTPVILGVVPVPSLQHHVRVVGARGGICVTASHNPMEWNALKFFGPDGIVLRPNQFAELRDLYHQGVYPRVPSDQIPAETEDESAAARHRDTVLKAVDVEAIRARKFKVVVDSCNGAASRASPAFLRSLGCEVVELYTDPGSPFPRDPEPVAQNLTALCRRVKESEADAGFALDADGDRLALVDEEGRPLGEDCTVALAVYHFLRRERSPVVVSMSTSRMVEDIASPLGCPVLRSKVGEINVIERMVECGARIGGEGNGGVIAMDINPCRDSFVGMALILEALSRDVTSLRRLRDRLPRYAIVKEKLPCRARHIASMLRLIRHLYRDEILDLEDGVKISWSDRWLHVRGSNTEPILRIAAEAPTEAEARSLVGNVLEYLRPIAQ